MQPIDAPIEESPYDFTQTRTELISNSMRAFIPSLCKGLEEWYKSRPNTPHDISDIDMSVISQSTATSMLLVRLISTLLSGYLHIQLTLALICRVNGWRPTSLIAVSLRRM